MAQVTWRPAWPWAEPGQSTDEPVTAPARILSTFLKPFVLVSVYLNTLQRKCLLKTREDRLEISKFSKYSKGKETEIVYAAF